MVSVADGQTGGVNRGVRVRNGKEEWRLRPSQTRVWEIVGRDGSLFESLDLLCVLSLV